MRIRHAAASEASRAARVGERVEPRRGEAREIDPAAGQGHVAQRRLAERRARQARLVDGDRRGRRSGREVGEVRAGHDRVGEVQVRQPRGRQRPAHPALDEREVAHRELAGPRQLDGLVAGLVLQRRGGERLGSASGRGARAVAAAPLESSSRSRSRSSVSLLLQPGWTTGTSSRALNDVGLGVERLGQPRPAAVLAQRVGVDDVDRRWSRSASRRRPAARSG